MVTAVPSTLATNVLVATGRNALQWPMEEGVRLLHAIQDVDLCADVTVA